MEDADSKLKGLDGKVGEGARVRSSQILAARSVVSTTLRAFFKNVEKIVRDEQSNAAGLAESLLIKDEKGLWSIVMPNPSDRWKHQQDLIAAAQRQTQAMMVRVLHTEAPLSRRIWNSESIAKGQLNRRINGALSRGDSAADLAKDVRDFVNPNTPGGASYRAKMLARTEINNAFHAQSISDAQSRPWIEEVYWNLSKSHNEQGCVCEQYAMTGLFPADRVPKKPHPGCLCSITPKLPDLDSVIKGYMSGQYGSYLPGSGMV